MNNSPLLNHYQTWLDDFTRINVFHGLYHQQITQWHRLTITSCLIPEGHSVEVVLPQRLLPLTRTGLVESCTTIPRLTKNIDYSLLPGVLLSEC
ncbi:secretoglobin family protein, partial [Enterobacter hormaechei]